MTGRTPVAVAVATAAAAASLLLGTSAAGAAAAAPATGTTGSRQAQGGAAARSYYLVPQGSNGLTDLTLPDVAERLLGDRDRWPEIFVLNRGVLQPDGTSLQQPGERLRVGWRLVLPAGVPAQAGGSGEVRTGTPPPAVAPPAAAPPAVAPPAAAVGTRTVLGVPLATAGIAGAAVAVVLAVLGALLGLRLARRGRPGPPRPRPARGGAPDPQDGPPRQRPALDRALAQLPAHARPHAALVGAARTSVRLTPPLPEAPPPWQVREQGAVWEVLDWQLEVAGNPAPERFPLFVAVGTVGGEWTAVNLGRAPGLVALPGDVRAAREALAGLVEQVARGAGATSVVVVGDLPGVGLPGAGPLRVRTVQEVPGPVFGRSAPPGTPGVLGDVWDRIVADAGSLHRQLVVITTPLSTADAEVLASLAARSDDTAAVLLLGDSPYASWRFEVAGGVLDLGVLGLRLDGAPAGATPGR